MKKILIIAPECPYPTNSGGRLRVYHVARQLAATHTVSLAYFNSTTQVPPTELVSLVKKCYPITVKNNPDHLLAKAVKVGSLVGGSFPAISFYARPDVLAAVQEIITEALPDIILTETSYLLPIPQFIRRNFPDITLILDAHNMEHRLHAAMGQTATNPLLALYKKLAARAIKRVEQQANDCIDALLAVSVEEQRQWQLLCPDLKILLVPNGVDIDYFKPRSIVPIELSLVYCGLMDYRPNVEGVLWFIAAIWPKIVQLFPEIKLYVVGRNPTEAIKQLSSLDQRIVVTGTVNDVRDWVAKSTLSVVPLLAGGGTRLKILEAMSLGKVVIATKIGAEGIQPAKGLLVAESADQFIELMKQYLALPQSALDKLGASNRQVVQKYYNWPIVVRELHAFIEDEE